MWTLCDGAKMGAVCGISLLTLACSRTVIVLAPHADGEANVHTQTVKVKAGSAETIEMDCGAPPFAQKVEVSWASGNQVQVRYWCAVDAPVVGGLEEAAESAHD